MHLLTYEMSRKSPHVSKKDGKKNLTDHPANNALWCIFAGDCVNGGLHLSEGKRLLTAAANSSFTCTQNILNVTVGRILEQETKEDRVFMFIDKISGQGITDGLWSQSLLINNHMEDIFVPHVLRLGLFGKFRCFHLRTATEGTGVLGATLSKVRQTTNKKQMIWCSW